jgi:hypothetical protein
MKQETSDSKLPSHFRLKTGIRFGLITSLISSFIGIALHTAGLTNYGSNSGSWIPVILLGLGIYLASEYFKKFNQGYMGQRDVVVVAIWLGLFSGLVSGIIMLIQLQFDASIISQMENMLEMQLEERGLEGADFEKAMEMGTVFFNPYFLGVSALISSVIMSLVVGFILSIFLKREKTNPFD